MRARLALAGMAAALASPAHAATGQSSTAIGQAQAVIIAPIIAVSLGDLDFGSLTSSPTASGSITVGAEGGATYAGGAAPACIGGGACAGIAPARFLVSGEAGRSYTVSAPAAITATGTLTAGGSAPSLAIDDVSVHLASHAGTGTSIGQLDDKGEDRIGVGGRLNVPAGTAAAHYRATLTIMVTYS
jgi:spore coat protein U-like protein